MKKNTNVNHCPSVSLDIETEFYEVAPERLKTGSIASTFKKMKTDLENKIADRLWVEMVFTKCIPEAFTIYSYVEDEVVDFREINIKEMYFLLMDTPKEMIENVHEFSRTLAADICKEIAYAIIHSSTLKEVNR